MSKDLYKTRDELHQMRREMTSEKYLLWDEYIKQLQSPFYVFVKGDRNRVKRTNVTKKHRGTENVERTKEILGLFGKGYTYKSIGSKYGLSRQRIHQIIKYNENNPVAV